MPYCPACKVALAPKAETCPLCNARSVESLAEQPHSSVSYSDNVRDADEKEKLSPAETRRMVVELLSVSFAIMLIATTGIDIMLFPGLPWSLFTGLILVVLWLFTAMPLLLWGRPWLIYAVLGPSLVLAFFLWALFSGGLSWFLFVGSRGACLLCPHRRTKAQGTQRGRRHPRRGRVPVHRHRCDGESVPSRDCRALLVGHRHFFGAAGGRVFLLPALSRRQPFLCFFLRREAILES